MLFIVACEFYSPKSESRCIFLHFFFCFSALAQRPSFPSSAALNLMISPSYPTNSRQRKGDFRCESLHLAAMHVNFHFISHLELVKHYHSITVNLKTMKSFGFSQNPPLLSICVFCILKWKQNFNSTNPKAINRTYW